MSARAMPIFCGTLFVFMLAFYACRCGDDDAQRFGSGLVGGELRRVADDVVFLKTFSKLSIRRDRHRGTLLRPTRWLALVRAPRWAPLIWS